ncbi:MAG: anaerobic ribonucleoside-triphosphate reductase activating protein [Clostridia bacterium]
MVLPTINLAGMVRDSIVDGPGIRTVFFAQGCYHNCEGCHNPETHSFGKGYYYTIDQLVEVAKRNKLGKGITFSGGDPFEQSEAFAILAKRLRSEKYELAAYTGYLFEELTSDDDKEFLKELDILIDGKFMIDRRNLDLSFRGSDNQRIIDVQKSLATGKVVLTDQERWINPRMAY